MAKTKYDKRGKHRGYSDSYLMQMWRRAVKAQRGECCARCGRPDVECHHVIRRGKGVLRHDWRNGLPLCTGCHAWADTYDGRQWVESQVDMEYLRAHDVVMTDYLIDCGLSRREFDLYMMRDLKLAMEAEG